MRLSIIIPCYNEAGTLRGVLQRTESASLPIGWTKEIIVVDDGSTDETRKILSSLSSQYLTLFRKRNGGKGAAVKDGLRAATGDYCIIQDADTEYDPQEYEALIEALPQATCIFGSRILHRNRRYSNLYYYGSRALTFVFNILFRSRFTDITTCYKLFPRSLVPRILAWKYDDFTFDAVALTYELHQAGACEVPISYYPRSRGDGKKIRWHHGIGCLRAMAAIFFGKYAQLVKFIIGGGTAFAINIIVLYFLTDIAGLYYLLSAMLAFLVAFAGNFVIQRFWTFGLQKRALFHRHIAQYFALQVSVNLALNTALLYVLVEWFNLWYLVAQTIISGLLAILTFAVSKRYIFIPAPRD